MSGARRTGRPPTVVIFSLMNLRLLALAGVVAVTVALPLAVASAGPVGDADPADVRASGRSQDSGHSQHSEDAALSDGAGHSAGSAGSADSADSEDGNDKGPAAELVTGDVGAAQLRLGGDQEKGPAQEIAGGRPVSDVREGNGRGGAGLSGRKALPQGGRGAVYKVVCCEQVPGTNRYLFVIEVKGGRRVWFDITTGKPEPARVQCG